jgi:hypothetical protein
VSGRQSWGGGRTSVPLTASPGSIHSIACPTESMGRVPCGPLSPSGPLPHRPLPHRPLPRSPIPLSPLPHLPLPRSPIPLSHAFCHLASHSQIRSYTHKRADTPQAEGYPTNARTNTYTQAHVSARTHTHTHKSQPNWGRPHHPRAPAASPKQARWCRPLCEYPVSTRCACRTSVRASLGGVSDDEITAQAKLRFGRGPVACPYAVAPAGSALLRLQRQLLQ